MKYLVHLFVMLACCWVLPLSAQDAKMVDVVYLNDGSILRGTIQHYDKGVFLDLLLKSGQTLKILEPEISKIVQEVEKTKASKNALAPGKLYHAVYFTSNVGSNFFNSEDWGMGLETSTGIWLDQNYGIGLGTGIVQFSADYAWRVVPLVVDFKLKGKGASPFLLTADAGIGFPLKNENLNIHGGKAGERIRLGIGKIWTTRSQTNLSVEFSYLHQRAEFDSFTWGWWGDGGETIRNIRFKRYHLRVGVLF